MSDERLCRYSATSFPGRSKASRQAGASDQSRWHLVWAARRDRADDARIKRYIGIYRSPEVREFVLARFKGTILPTW
ncbi:hypothetical protein SAE02_06020 [Skermanella aerolata]|uniref:Uncharacterized protein n=1 Tax=Skermanella aerolata TaxID=393310 RepID=A0A512DIZ6_9PROT|nr:MetQ/NlpA family ABC transporter substrate-binding protein [Skermanella aerolata]GEO36454.1 hypothetical protein SAE02_06020 [Skermanella aerolata]